MTDVSSLLGIGTILIVIVGVAFLVGLFYLGDRSAGRRDDSDPRPRRRY
ncbi:hypothetical protein [Actinomadura sp. 7K507]|nr:hypothetical protein [Actinomadura sp. 7K507]